MTATNDQIAKGREIELNYNPTASWTMKLNVTKQESIDANLAPEVSVWLASRIAHWKTIIDPTINRPWFTERYNNGTPAADFIAANATAPLSLAQATEGKSRPQIRKYRANFSTNYRLAGLTERTNALNGSLTASITANDWFRLAIDVPTAVHAAMADVSK